MCKLKVLVVCAWKAKRSKVAGVFTYKIKSSFHNKDFKIIVAKLTHIIVRVHYTCTFIVFLQRCNFSDSGSSNFDSYNTQKWVAMITG